MCLPHHSPEPEVDSERGFVLRRATEGFRAIGEPQESQCLLPPRCCIATAAESLAFRRVASLRFFALRDQCLKGRRTAWAIGHTEGETKRGSQLHKRGASGIA